jgi:hypothetical protein
MCVIDDIFRPVLDGSMCSCPSAEFWCWTVLSWNSREIMYWSWKEILVLQWLWCGNSWCKCDIYQTKTNSVALSPRANYTDWSTATCQRNLVSTFVDRGVSHGQRGGSPTVVNLSFLDRSRYFSFKYLLIYCDIYQSSLIHTRYMCG